MSARTALKLFEAQSAASVVIGQGILPLDEREVEAYKIRAAEAVPYNRFVYWLEGHGLFDDFGAVVMAALGSAVTVLMLLCAVGGVILHLALGIGLMMAGVFLTLALLAFCAMAGLLYMVSRTYKGPATWCDFSLEHYEKGHELPKWVKEVANRFADIPGVEVRVSALQQGEIAYDPILFICLRRNFADVATLCIWDEKGEPVFL